MSLGALVGPRDLQKRIQHEKLPPGSTSVVGVAEEVGEEDDSKAATPAWHKKELCEIIFLVQSETARSRTCVDIAIKEQDLKAPTKDV